MAGDAPSVEELALWTDLWHSSQAVAWSSLGWTRIVARYVRIALEAERPRATGSVMGEARQLEDRLGLTPMAMRRLQWEIEADAVPESPAEVSSLDDYREQYG